MYQIHCTFLFELSFWVQTDLLSIPQTINGPNNIQTNLLKNIKPPVRDRDH